MNKNGTPRVFEGTDVTFFTQKSVTERACRQIFEESTLADDRVQSLEKQVNLVQEGSSILKSHPFEYHPLGGRFFF